MVKTTPHNEKLRQIQILNDSKKIKSKKSISRKINSENNSKEIKINIASKIFIQNSLFKKATGLMFRKKINDFAMIFPFKKEQKISLTMFCVFFPIDVIFLDEHNKVIELKENFKPFQNYDSKQKIRIFIEVPKNTISKYELKLKDSISWSKDSLILIKQR